MATILILHWKYLFHRRRRR